MKADSQHIKSIKVVSNTHWDREFRKSFEKTRRALLTMMDTTLDILEKDSAYHSFTMDGYSIMIEDYLEIRPERKEQVERFINQGRLIIGPYYTLAEQFSISHEPIVRNLMWGRNLVEKYGGKPGTVAYTPSSWGQTGQLPQILSDFGLTRMMFYRGISHHESDAEYIWKAPDGTPVFASRFALYARYNWYYQVHRAVTRGKVFDKGYHWGKYDEVPLRLADAISGEDQSFILQDPALEYDKTQLGKAIEDMVEREGAHFTTDVFLAMHGHDISVAHPLESRIIEDAKEVLCGRYEIEHTDLEGYWDEVQRKLDPDKLSVLTGERRSYLKQGMWTFLFPGTISARSYLKQQDFRATTGLVYYAEPLGVLACTMGADYPKKYIDRGWQYLMSNHTHDANGGCAPDAVCLDMEYRYRKACDIGDIVTEDAMSYIAGNLSPAGIHKDAMQLVVYNPLLFKRDITAVLDLEIPRQYGAKSFTLASEKDNSMEYQAISNEKSSVFVDSIWEVPTILESNRIRQHVSMRGIPAMGYRVYSVNPEKSELRNTRTLVTGPNTMENEFMKVTVNLNGTVNIKNRQTGRVYENVNYLSDQGECGNAWKHVKPVHDRKYSSIGVTAGICVTESGPLTSAISAAYNFPVPMDYADGMSRSSLMVDLPVSVEYRLDKGSDILKITLTVDNTAKDHWLRANIPTGIDTDVTWADSHFDVLSRPIPIPDSNGWVEEAGGTHPLRTFVDMNDGREGIGLITKGIFEYEAFEDEKRTLALTLIRACRIKLAVSEEKMSELPDNGIQCPGIQKFEYAVCVHEGDWNAAGLLYKAAEYYTPVRMAMTGRGKGKLPMESSVFSVDSKSMHTTCVKLAEEGKGIIVRLFNPLDRSEKVTMDFGVEISSVYQYRMDEGNVKAVAHDKNRFEYEVGAKKICTFRIELGE